MSVALHFYQLHLYLKFSNSLTLKSFTCIVSVKFDLVCFYLFIVSCFAIIGPNLVIDFSIVPIILLSVCFLVLFSCFLSSSHGKHEPATQI